MHPLEPGTPEPATPGVPAGPHVVVFYKTTCPVCQMAAPAVDALARANPGLVVAVGQDPEAELEEFRAAYGIRTPTIQDLPPYEVSDAWGVQVVPTLFLVDSEGRVADMVESWDRAGFDRVAEGLATATGGEFAPVSHEGDGLPAFRPG